jgi:hypothetical protein
MSDSNTSEATIIEKRQQVLYLNYFYLRLDKTTQQVRAKTNPAQLQNDKEGKI